MDLSWMAGGLCQEVDPYLFFDNEHSHATANARSVCAVCPVQQECLDYAIRQPNLHGVWGGTTRSERWELRSVILTAGELADVVRLEAAEDDLDVLQLVAA